MYTFSGGDRPNVPNTLFIITDGVPNVGVDRTVPEAINAHIDGGYMFICLSVCLSSVCLTLTPLAVIN